MSSQVHVKVARMSTLGRQLLLGRCVVLVVRRTVIQLGLEELGEGVREADARVRVRLRGLLVVAHGLGQLLQVVVVASEAAGAAMCQMVSTLSFSPITSTAPLHAVVQHGVQRAVGRKADGPRELVLDPAAHSNRHASANAQVASVTAPTSPARAVLDVLHDLQTPTKRSKSDTASERRRELHDAPTTPWLRAEVLVRPVSQCWKTARDLCGPTMDVERETSHPQSIPISYWFPTAAISPSDQLIDSRAAWGHGSGC
jgi:hypothetical protein